MPVSMLLSSANAAFIAELTASSFNTGNTPGYPRSNGLTFVFGSLPNPLGLVLNTLESVFSSTWTSRPIIVSKFTCFHLPIQCVSYYGLLLVQTHVPDDRQSLPQSSFQSLASRWKDHPW